MTYTRYDPDEVVLAELARERYMATDIYQFDLADWLAEQASEFEFTARFERCFEAWLDDQEEQFDG